MATCSAIINRALRKIGKLGAGRDARTNDAEDALDVLRGMYLAWIASGAFGRLADVVVNSDYTAGENQRVVRPVGVTAEITLPDFVPMYAEPRPYNLEVASYESVDGNTRPPKDCSVVVIADQESGTVQNWVYSGSLKQWQSIDAIALIDPAPRSDADPDGLAALLAIEVSDQFGGDVSPVTLAAAARYRQEITHRYSMPRTVTAGVYC